MLENYAFLFDVFQFKAGVPTALPIVLGVIMGILLLVCMKIDLKEMILPDLITIPCLVASALLSVVLYEHFVVHLLIGGLVLVLFWMASKVKIRGKNAMGLGDAKLYSWLGFALAQAVFPIIFFAALIGAIHGTVIGLFDSIKDKQVPHGPHIVLATFVVTALAVFAV